jgi:hypothetical protein
MKLTGTYIFTLARGQFAKRDPLKGLARNYHELHALNNGNPQYHDSSQRKDSLEFFEFASSQLRKLAHAEIYKEALLSLLSKNFFPPSHHFPTAHHLPLSAYSLLISQLISSLVCVALSLTCKLSPPFHLIFPCVLHPSFPALAHPPSCRFMASEVDSPQQWS